MANYIPTLVSGGNTPSVSVKMANGYDYSEFISSLSSIVYMVLQIGIKADEDKQTEQNYNFNYKDSAGNTHTDVIPFVNDPNQKQIWMEFIFKSGQYLLNGQTALAFTLLAGQTINIYLATLIFDPSDLIKNIVTAKRGYLFIGDIQNHMKNYADKINLEMESGYNDPLQSGGKPLFLKQ